MSKFSIFIIVAIVATFYTDVSANVGKDCDGVPCQDFCCEVGQLCCYDTMSGTYYCDKKCDFKMKVKSVRAKLEPKKAPKDCDGIPCKDFCCETGQLCCYDSWSGTYFCDKKCDFNKKMKTVKAKPEPRKAPKDCDGIPCKDFCCEAGQLCCYDSWSGTYFCDKKCTF